jgi:glycosyltransferase involved in cell wall biosynthesis
MIPVYNRTASLANALASLLNQDLDPASTQIEVVDGSNIAADFRSIITQFPQLHIDYYKQPCDLSISGDWNSCIERARNELVHVLHDDDWVLPGFYATYSTWASRYPDAGFIAGRCKVMLPDGSVLRTTPFYPELSHPTTNEEPFYYYADIQCPAIVVRKTCYAACGGFDSRLRYFVDREMWIRAIKFCGGVMHGEVLACFSTHGESYTTHLKERALDVEDAMRFVRVVKEYSPKIREEVFVKRYRAELLRRIAKHALRGNYACLPGLLSVYRSLRGETRLPGDVLRAALRRF